MKTILLAAALVGGLASQAYAKRFELPEANPAAVVVIPDTWKPSETDTGLEATSPDGESYIAADTATMKGIEGLVRDDVEFLRKQGVTIDPSTQQKRDSTINGMSISLFRWSGTDKDGPTLVTLGVVGVTDNLVLLLTSWSSPAGEKANEGDLTAILQSITKR